MLRTAPRQERFDPASSQPAPLRFRVIASVAIQAVRTAARPTRLAARTGGIASTSPRSCVTSFTLAAVVVAANGTPCPSVRM